MKQIKDTIHPNPKNRTGLLSIAVLLGVALIATACSSATSASQPPTTNETPVSTTAAPTPAESTPPNSEPESNSEPASNAVEAIFDEVEASSFDGVIAVRVGADVTTRAFGVADRENDASVDAETVFDIASITKQFTAAAILRLEMDGLLSVDDTLGEHIPGLPEEQGAITLHQLLTHTSGVTRDIGIDDEPIDRDGYLARVAETPLRREPGSQFAYSNVGYSLLAAVVEFAAGEPYEAYLRRTLFEPAGMLDTGYVLPEWDENTIAVGYRRPSGDRFGRPNEQPWDVDGPYWNLFGNGGILSTATDMLRWDEALHGNHVLDETAKSKYFAPHVADGLSEGRGYGYGWEIVNTPMGTPLITHSGSNLVFWSDLLRFVDQDVAVFLATNSFEEDFADLALGVANAVFDGGLEGAFDDDEVKSEPDTDAEPDAAAAADTCGFGDISIDSLSSHPEIETLPDSPSGHAASLLLNLLAEGGAEGRLDFATEHVSAKFGDGDPSAIAVGIGYLQQQFADYELVRVHEQDDHRFHLLMEGPNVEVLLSLGFDETAPGLLTCFAVA